MSQMSAEIGDVQFSFLPPTPFKALHGNNWVQVTAQSLAGTALGALLAAAGITLANLPDLRDQFIRGAGGTLGAAVGIPQAQGTAVNGLSSPPHAHGYQNGSNFAPNNGNLTTQNNGGAATNQNIGTNAASAPLSSGDPETRPMNVALYAYARLN